MLSLEIPLPKSLAMKSTHIDSAITNSSVSVTFADIKAAAERLKNVAHRTPVFTSKTLDRHLGARAFLKCENLQRMGAFKFRGAYNRLAQLSDSERANGVVAYSSGNHAQGVALAAQILAIQATIVMPADAPKAKIEATRNYGAEVVLYDRNTEDRVAIAKSIADKRGAAVVPPYDHSMIIAGQGTAALELIEEVGALDVLLVPVGGGGLLSGCAIAAVSLCPEIKIYGVEPAKGDDFRQSFHAGERIKIPVPDTIADGMQTQSPGELTFPIVKNLCTDILTVTDDQLRSAMLFAFERLKLVIEPSGAASLAAALFNKANFAKNKIGIIISGGNIDPSVFIESISKAEPFKNSWKS